MRRALISTIALAAMACGPSADTDAGGAAAITQEARDQLKVELITADRAFAESVGRTGLGAWLAAFGPNGIMVSNGASHSGQDGIRRQMLPLFADSLFTLTWDPNFAEVAEGGDLGYTIGTYQMTASGSDGLQNFSGSYLTVWRRNANGVWKVEADIGSPASE
jgi:ketosteroid isomerase-like protein